MPEPNTVKPTVESESKPSESVRSTVESQPELQNFYFTYGTDELFPFKGGWTKVRAYNLGQAIAAFRAIHPSRPGSTVLNCAFFYTEDDFKSSEMYKFGNLGAFMHEQIQLSVVSCN